MNNVYKLQFFTFIFAVLLPVLSRHILSFSVWLQRFLQNEHSAGASSEYLHTWSYCRFGRCGIRHNGQTERNT